MAKDGRKGSAYESGMRGSQKPASVPSLKQAQKLLLPGGAEGLNIKQGANAIMISADIPAKGGKGYEYRPPVPYSFPTGKDAIEWLKKQLGVKDDEGDKD
jgi:hypothetical protein